MRYLGEHASLLIRLLFRSSSWSQAVAVLALGRVVCAWREGFSFSLAVVAAMCACNFSGWKQRRKTVRACRTLQVLLLQFWMIIS